MKICEIGICPVHNSKQCCHYCPEFSTCESGCERTPDECESCKEETDIMAFNAQHLALFQDISAIVTQKKALEATEKGLKDKLRQAMEHHGIKSIDHELLKIVYIAPTVMTSIDGDKLKRLHPAIAVECQKTSNKSGYVKITLKDGDK